MMKNQRIAVLLFLLVQCCLAQSAPQKPDVESRVNSILAKMTVEEKIEMLGGFNDFYTRPIPQLGVPALKMSDGPMGVHDYGLTTAYPAGIALAASWDVDLAHRFGIAMGNDARARGVHFILAPGMNIYRAPMNGRNFEYVGLGRNSRWRGCGEWRHGSGDAISVVHESRNAAARA
jgi:beta-glucosidase